VVAELRDAGVTLPIIATGGIRSVDDCREYFWAGADAVSLGSASWLTSFPGYALAPLHAARVRRILRVIEHYHQPPGQRGTLPSANPSGSPMR
jgi:dihydroorotate dehydrogenase (NAD+) catalytic subunit